MTTNTRETDITVDPDVPLVRITRDFDAPPEKVFRAHTDPDLVVQWLGPRSLQMRIDYYDCRTGGPYRHLPVKGQDEVGFPRRLPQVPPHQGVLQTVSLETAPHGRPRGPLPFPPRATRP